jgi:eukaryotic-like serine/threonine-protein kinase
VAGWAGAKLWKASVDGGTPVALCDAEDLLGGSWGDNGMIVAAITTSGLWQVPSTGGSPVRIEGIPENVGARWPHMLPGSNAVLFSAGAPATGPPRIAVFSFTDRTVKDRLNCPRYNRLGAR